MPISFLFFLKKKKEVGERKKKKQVRTYRENRSKKSARGFKEQVAPQRPVEDFGLFARKVSALPKRKLRR